MISEFKEVIDICEEYAKNNPLPTKVEDVVTLMIDVNPILSKIKVTKENLPYGRYLIHQDKYNEFNIQVHVFSPRYEGYIHCHTTWGIMTIIKGTMCVTDWVEDVNSFECIRSSLVKKGGSVCFCPPAQDWHKTDTSTSDLQAVSVHIYGKGWDMDNGIYVDKSFLKVEGSRGEIKDNSLLFPYIISMDNN